MISSGSAGDQLRCAMVVVTYNSAADLAGFFDGLHDAADGVELSVVIVDNDSQDDTVALVPDQPGVSVVQTGANLGYSGGINVGLATLSTDIPVLIANPDMRFEPGSIRLLVEALDDETIGVVVPRLLGPDGDTRPSLRRFPSITRELGEACFGDAFPSRPGWLSEIDRDPDSYEAIHDADWATGAAFLIAPRCHQAVGEWDERYFLYSEEVDYARRARNAGFRLRYLPSARTMHREGGSGTSETLVALMAVNRVRYAERFHGRIWSTLYRAVVVFHELSRGFDPARRRAAWQVARRRSWAALPSRPAI